MAEKAAISEQEVRIEQKVRSVFKEYRFVLLFLTLLVSSFSVSFFMLATNWYVVDYLNMEAMLGLVFFASSVPRLVFMLIGGVIADRISKAWIMFLSDVTKGVLLFGVIGLLVYDILSIWPLVALSFLFGVLDAFFWPASSAVLPETVKQEQLTRANSIVNMTRQISLIAGPVLAAAMLAFGGYVFIFAITALTLLIAGFIDVLLKRKENEEREVQVQETEGGSVFNSMKEGFQYVKGHSFLVTLMISAVFLNLFFTGPIMLGLPIFAMNVLHGNELTYSYLSGGIAGGMVLGAMLIGILNVQKKRGFISILGIAVLGLFFIGLSVSSNFWMSLTFVILIGMASSAANVPLFAVIQHYTKKEYLGRVMSLTTFAAMGLVPISYLMTSLFIAMNISIEMIMLGSSICLTLVCFTILFKAKALRAID
ncbi:MFS transporter [Evansella halocellulosilytica]|uniref:MFS transporter n=1 Tax=Evansella halocellulosilytica TaxID=2011013 RepID=UPI000BB8431D|nr:MFS transporter [Evansella halocellulosilytica]